MVVRGGGELASAAARLLFLAGFRVVVLERAEPLAVRRLVSFAQAVTAGEVTVEGVVARRSTLAEAAIRAASVVPVVVDETAGALGTLRPQVVVDARMAKRTDRAQLDAAPLVVGLGPGLVAGRDVHAVVETQRGPDLGRVLWSGSAEPDTTLPAPVLGVTTERVLRAPAAGRFRGRARIGEVVAAGDVVGEVDGEPVFAATSGLLRGLLADGVAVPAGTKVGDIDPRGTAVRADRISDKARAVAAGVLEAVLVGGKGPRIGR